MKSLTRPSLPGRLPRAPASSRSIAAAGRVKPWKGAGEFVRIPALGLTLVATIALSLAAPPALAQALPNLGGGVEREDLSPLMERKVGERIMQEIRRDRDYVDDVAVLEYINTFGNKLVSAQPEVRGEAAYDFFFFAVRDPTLNAFALPGGFIGMHTALIMAAQSESELASVIAHEIGHVSQRHIARMIGAQKQDMLLPLASILLGVLAARSSPDLAMASMMGGTGLAIQRQLNFTRDAEREADRIGLQILTEGGFETGGMVGFFGRMQSAGRAYNDSAPAYLRSHPLTTERIADIQDRIRGQRYRQRADSLDFHLIRARLRVLQDDTAHGRRDAAASFDGQVAQGTRAQMLAARYGLAVAAQRDGDPEKARAQLAEVRKSMRAAAMDDSVVLASLDIELGIARKQYAEAVATADAARQAFPLARGIARQYGQALIEAGRLEQAIGYLREQALLYRAEAPLQDLLARAYADSGRKALQHMALAESYALGGSVPAALDQLRIARASPDASFYDHSMIDARERELQARRRQELEDEGKK